MSSFCRVAQTSDRNDNRFPGVIQPEERNKEFVSKPHPSEMPISRCFLGQTTPVFSSGRCHYLSCESGCRFRAGRFKIRPCPVRKRKPLILRMPVGGDFLRSAFQSMLKARILENKLSSLYKAGKIVGGVYLGRGQEAISASLGTSLDPGAGLLCPADPRSGGTHRVWRATDRLH